MLSFRSKNNKGEKTVVDEVRSFRRLKNKAIIFKEVDTWLILDGEISVGQASVKIKQETLTIYLSKADITSVLVLNKEDAIQYAKNCREMDEHVETIGKIG